MYRKDEIEKKALMTKAILKEALKERTPMVDFLFDVSINKEVVHVNSIKNVPVASSVVKYVTVDQDMNFKKSINPMDVKADTTIVLGVIDTLEDKLYLLREPIMIELVFAARSTANDIINHWCENN